MPAFCVLNEIASVLRLASMLRLASGAFLFCSLKRNETLRRHSSLMRPIDRYNDDQLLDSSLDSFIWIFIRNVGLANLTIFTD